MKELTQPTLTIDSKTVLIEGERNLLELVRKAEIDLPTFAPFALFDPALGMTTILPDMDFSKPGSVDAAHLVALMEKHGVTNMFGSPAVLNRLVELGKPLPRTLRRVLSAGAPMRPVVLDGGKERHRLAVYASCRRCKSVSLIRRLPSEPCAGGRCPRP